MKKFSPYEILQVGGNSWFWRITAKNGRVVGCGWGYNTRRNARTGLLAIIRMATQFPLIPQGL